jgi:DtxR family Mn-dependent transcriptional regulator
LTRLEKDSTLSVSYPPCPTTVFPRRQRHFPSSVPAMKKTADLSASLEDYIETIYHIIEEKLVARSKEIAARLNVSRASVTEALRALSRKGLINYEPYEAITLTPQGKRAAKDVIFRHQALRQFFVEVLALDEGIAEDGACRIEHAAPPEIIDRLIHFTEFISLCPHGGIDLINGFKSHCAKEKPRASRQASLTRRQRDVGPTA